MNWTLYKELNAIISNPNTNPIQKLGAMIELRSLLNVLIEDDEKLMYFTVDCGS